tara:strand:- start:252 stop:353 length:102 start_codon:yes stop_codon:yes gene_type:complete
VLEIVLEKVGKKKILAIVPQETNLLHLGQDGKT